MFKSSPEQRLTLPTGYSIEPASCGGFHVKHNGRTIRQDRKPLIFNDPVQSVQYAWQHAGNAQMEVER
jgi:hypothetical protein